MLMLFYVKIWEYAIRLIKFYLKFNMMSVKRQEEISSMVKRAWEWNILHGVNLKSTSKIIGRERRGIKSRKKKIIKRHRV